MTFYSYLLFFKAIKKAFIRQLASHIKSLAVKHLLELVLDVAVAKQTSS